ncbi:unnamed protein product, partial [Polarella glacialis]
MGAACARRKPPGAFDKAIAKGEKPFWEEIDQARAQPVATDAPSAVDGEAEASGRPPASEVELKEDAELPGYEQAALLKDQGKEKFASGQISEAATSWFQALDSLPRPPPSTGSLPSALQSLMPGGPPKDEDSRIREMRVALWLNLAAAHIKLKKMRQALDFCNEALHYDPGNVKALYRKTDALGELCNWQEAEEAALKLQGTGEEGAKLASQKREEWRRRRRQEDNKEKKMWSAALDKELSGKPEPKAAPGAKDEELWAAPKVTMMSNFDLRRMGIKWNEEEDFSDTIWKDSPGRKDVLWFQKRALPLSLLAAAALAEIDLPKQEDLVVHCFLDGNTAPFSEPHDWGILLTRCPLVKNLLVVYIDIGDVSGFKGPDGGKPPMYATLMRPTEEGRVGDRVAMAARFMGNYKEFLAHCSELPKLLRPSVALWADVSFYGSGSKKDFAARLQALELLSKAGVPSVVTQGGEIWEPGGRPMERRVDENASLSLAIASVGLNLKELVPWQFNRFVVPLDRGQVGIFAAHQLLGVLAGPAEGEKSSFDKKDVEEALL